MIYTHYFNNLTSLLRESSCKTPSPVSTHRPQAMNLLYAMYEKKKSSAIRLIIHSPVTKVQDSTLNPLKVLPWPGAERLGTERAPSLVKAE